MCLCLYSRETLVHPYIRASPPTHQIPPMQRLVEAPEQQCILLEYAHTDAQGQMSSEAARWWTHDELLELLDDDELDELDDDELWLLDDDDDELLLELLELLDDELDDDDELLLLLLDDELDDDELLELLELLDDDDELDDDELLELCELLDLHMRAWSVCTQCHCLARASSHHKLRHHGRCQQHNAYMQACMCVDLSHPTNLSSDMQRLLPCTCPQSIWISRARALSCCMLYTREHAGSSR